MKANGDCYKVAAEKVMFALEFEDALVCHGTCTATGGPITGHAFGHAWIEVGDVVFDFSNGRSGCLRKEMYYKVGMCRNVQRYTREQARRMLLKHKNYGPWHEDAEINYEKLLTLTKTVGRVRK